MNLLFVVCLEQAQKNAFTKGKVEKLDTLYNYGHELKHFQCE